MSNGDVARAFSGHRFEETFDHLDPDVQWILVGQGRVEGADAVVQACRSSAAEMAQVETTWVRFVAAGASDSVAIDAIGRYDGPDGVFVVSSYDIFELDDGKVTKITSYAVDVDPADPAVPAS